MDYKYYYKITPNEGKNTITVSDKLRPKDDEYVTFTFEGRTKGNSVEWFSDGTVKVNGKLYTEAEDAV